MLLRNTFSDQEFSKLLLLFNMGWYSTVLRSKLKKQTPKQTKIILYEHGEVPSVKKKVSYKQNKILRTGYVICLTFRELSSCSQNKRRKTHRYSSVLLKFLVSNFIHLHLNGKMYAGTQFFLPFTFYRSDIHLLHLTGGQWDNSGGVKPKPYPLGQRNSIKLLVFHIPSIFVQGNPLFHRANSKMTKKHQKKVE